MNVDKEFGYWHSLSGILGITPADTPARLQAIEDDWLAEAEFTQDIEYCQSLRQHALTVRKYPPVARHLSLLLLIEAHDPFRRLQQLFVQIEQARDAVAIIRFR